jgi:phage-related protein
MQTEKKLNYGMSMDEFPQHCIKYGNFDSKRFRLHLNERMAGTPSEKEVTASIPYMQGVVDMSRLLGNRIYANREITYVFYRFGVDMHRASERSMHPKNSSHTARDFQTTIENQTMCGFDEILYDSFEPDFHYIGKCKEITVEDEYSVNRLRVEIKFDLYPFKIANHTEAEDLFDPFNFDMDAFHNGLTFAVSGGQRILLYNASQKVLTPTVTGTSNMRIEKDGAIYEVRSGETQTPGLRLKLGMNELQVSGTGTLRFDWRKERI